VKKPRVAVIAWTTVLVWSAAVQAADIHDAVRSGDIAAVNAALDAAAVDLDTPARDGLTPLLWAAQANDLALARLLLEAGADADARNRYGISPLWLAATNRSAELVQVLLEYGADAGAAMPHGETPLMAAARSGDAESIRLLIAAGADPNAAETSLGETALMWAAAEDHAGAVRALVEGGADPDRTSLDLDLAPMDWVQVGMVSTVLPVGGWAPLLFAARENAPAAALALVEQGADPDVQDPDGNTAVLLALANDHYDFAALLLEAGADPNVADRTGMNALYAAVDRVTAAPDFGRPAVPRFDEHDAVDLVRLAIAHGADPNARLTGPTLARHHGFPDRSVGAGGTPLMRAAQGHDLESARRLLDAGAMADAQKDDGASALHVMAAARAAPGDEAAAVARELLDLLLAAGAEIDGASMNGQTPMHRAAASGNAGFIDLLFERGARLDAVDEEGRTPLELVALPGRTHNPEIAELLTRLAANRASP
jgi:ankyrin repeat protein